jgi:hypothetical protein
MKIETVKISAVKSNPNNPRIIKDDKFKKLVTSIKEFPQMLDIRPIVVNDEMIVLGGNMRLKASQEVGLKELPIILADDWTQEQRNEFLIKDNVGFGEWDWDLLANEWDSEQLEEWGIFIPNFDANVNLDDFFEEDNSEKEQKNKITLEYTEDEYQKVVEAFSKLSGSKESIIYKFSYKVPLW